MQVYYSACWLQPVCQALTKKTYKTSMDVCNNICLRRIQYTDHATKRFCTSPSQFSTSAIVAHRNKTAPFLWACGKDGYLTWHHHSSHCVNPWDAQGLEASPWILTSRWKQTCSRISLDWTHRGDMPGIEHVGSISWKRLHSSQSSCSWWHDNDSQLLLAFCVFFVGCFEFGNFWLSLWSVNNY